MWLLIVGMFSAEKRELFGSNKFQNNLETRKLQGRFHRRSFSLSKIFYFIFISNDILLN